MNNNFQIKEKIKSMKSIVTWSLHLVKSIIFSCQIMALLREKVIQRTYSDYLDEGTCKY